MSAQDDLVERVARAICGRNCDMPKCSCQSTLGSKQTCRAMSIAMARAAIEAMREPTEEMVERGREKLSQGDVKVQTHARVIWVWEGMIDAALTHPANSLAPQVPG